MQFLHAALDAASGVSYIGPWQGLKRTPRRVGNKFYYRFAFTSRFPYYGERAGETRADHLALSN